MKKKRTLLGVLLTLSMVFTTCLLPVFASVETSAETSTETESFTKKNVVVLDPGHGGKDSGSYVVHKGHVYKESTINWKIACYTMEELQKYPDIEVYMTRTKNQYKALDSRVLTAKSYGADLLVSQHVNSTESPYVKGASVLISKGTYRSYLSEKEKLFGKCVIKELTRLGLSKRYSSTGGMEYRMSTDGSRYANGARRDYYAIVAKSVEENLPGVIIEHAFISNPSEANKYLRTNKQLKKLGQADARAIVSYFNQVQNQEPKKDTVTPDKKNGWKKSGKYYYYYIKGKKQKNRVLNLDDGIYYVDKKGRRFSGWKTVKDARYYFGENGKAHTGWLNENGKWYCFNTKTGAMYKKCTVKSSTGKEYKFDAKGICTNRTEE
nr:N-acetylmuramoyl-L-alanine amidase [uncultured Blautia sp.]